MKNPGVLVVLRGNSGSGKSSVAAAVQRRFERGTCAVVSQDAVRRQLLREPDEPDRLNIALIEHIALFCLARGLITIVEGILDAQRYSAMLERVASNADAALFYAFDLSLAETLTRHAQRPQAASIPPELMEQWYHGWQPLAFTTETRIDSTWPLEAITDRICRDLAATGVSTHPDDTTP
ncbi:AAA family ATPase [Nocardia sp. CDC159]|uniref:AAA family ATPase n=1 Tax=Nocardia pulmonis TaxID=2951408 RepID=A0A9X2IY15_9NOCA|nr:MULTISPECIES: AAA family ATPase [Nocardia]MCM6774475.1 AAA family ATPase [Nocardia pulmonis]MCM6787459.1 AAA family ATPase [Nocardia sp. CDC159]